MWIGAPSSPIPWSSQGTMRLLNHVHVRRYNVHVRITLAWNFKRFVCLSIQPDPKDPVVDLASNTPIVSGDVTGYLVTVTGMTPVNLNSITTWYTADISENVQDEYAVSIPAENILGVGNPASLGPYRE